MWLAACAGPAGTGKADDRALLLIEEAQAQRRKGNAERAVALLQEAARLSPANATPWIASANMHLEASNPLLAAEAVREALRREPASQEANQLMALAGVRVAAEAFRNMRPGGPVPAALRLEAEALAANLRVAGALKREGEQAGATDKAASDATSRPRPAAVPRPQPGSAPAASMKDPFRSLK
jgi:tetratricopeptide (TPR) repeat protein